MRKDLGFHKRMHTCIGCICLIFLHCAFSNVSSKRLSKRSHSCIGAFSIQFEGTFENAWWRKVKQMPPMQLWLLLGRRFEDTFENAQWRKIKQSLYIMTSHQPYGLTKWNLFEFSGASENSREHLRFYWSVCDFTAASESQRGF